MDIDSLLDFALVASNGSIAQASRASGRPKATLSRKVLELEAALGVRLFERGARSVQLTEEGRLLYERSASPLSELEEITAYVREGASQPRGCLRLNVPAVFGQVLMGRLAAEFTKLYPKIRLQIRVDDREVDLVAEGFDVVVRINPQPDAMLVGRCFVRDRLVVVAHPSLVAPWDARASEHGAIPAVVRNASEGHARWLIEQPVQREINITPVLELPCFPMIRDAIMTGIGIATLPQVLIAEDLKQGRLCSWGFSAHPPAELWVLHASNRLTSEKVKAFVKFLQAQFPDGWL